MADRPVLMTTAIDALDVRALAAFYAELLGLHPRAGDEDDDDWQVLLDEDGRRVLAVNKVDRLARATWPDDDVPKQLHMDFRVPDTAALERHRARAEELGARTVFDRTEHEEPLYVLADPEGHPFCLLVAPE
jgi:catechol-2,3-dioxygenase